MAFLIYSVLVFVAMVAMLSGKPTDTQADTLTVTARFLKVDDPSSNRHRALTKQDIDHLGRGEKHHVRIRFDTGLPPLDMYLTQGSVWNSAKAPAVLPSDSKRPVSQILDVNCFLRGKLIRSDGAVSINRCGKLTGSIQTSHYQYQIEELVYPEGEEQPGPATFKVVRTTQKRREMGEDEDEEYTQSIMDTVKEKMAENENHNNETIDRQKRQAPVNGIYNITIEMVAYLDANYADYLYYQRNMGSSEIWDYIITKWNLVEAALDDPELVGARVTIALKDVIIWWSNPEEYPADEAGVSERLHWFRDNTPDTNHYDAKVLYTKGTGGHQMGLATVSGVCGSSNVFLVKSPGPDVSVEIHELGHSLGFDHDPDIDGCDSDGHNGGGFMGWQFNLRYLPCYRPVLKRHLRSRGHRCLFEENV